MPTQVYLGADHGGFQLKETLKAWLTEQKDVVIHDAGSLQHDPQDDYPKFAFAVAQQVAQQPDAVGVLLCRSAGGMVIAANKVDGVRAVSATTVEQAKHAKEHNDANVLAISGDFVQEKVAVEMLKVFLGTPFSNAERHVRRLAQISAYEQTE